MNTEQPDDVAKRNDAARPVALITGASSGFGLATARLFARNGYAIVALARRAERLEALASEFPGTVETVACDIADLAAVRERIAALPEKFTAIDVLVNNAGLARGLGSAAEANFDDWQRMVQVNITGLMHLTQLLLPRMLERKLGHVVNLGSIAGEFPYPGGNVYGATKAFVHQFSRNLRADLLGTPLRVTVIEPGLSGETEFSTVRFDGDAAKAAKVYENTQPLLPEDIAEAIWWSVTRPAHVNIDVMSILPTCQAFSPLAVSRTAK